MKKFLAFFVVLTFGCIVLFASGGKDSVDGTSESKSLTIAHVQGEDIWDALQEFTDYYHELSGNTVEWVYVPYGEMDNWAKTQFVGGTMTDLMWFSNQDANTFYKNDWIAPITDQLNATSPYTSKVWKDSFLEGILEGGKDDTGKENLGIPVTAVKVMLYYNKDIFSEVGLPDRAPVTYSEMLAAAKKIAEYNEKNGTEYIPYSLQNSIWWNMDFLYQSAMQDLWWDVIDELDIITPNGVLEKSEQALGIKSGIIDITSQRMIDYYAFLKEFSQYFNKGYNVASWEFEGLFNTGKAAMALNGSWFYRQHLSNGYSVNYGSGVIPYIDSGVTSFSMNRAKAETVESSGAEVIISQNAVKNGNFDAAVDFLQFWTDPDTGAKDWTDKQMLTPTVKGVQVPSIMDPVINSLGSDKPTIWNLRNFTDEADGESLVLYQNFMEDDTSPEEFAKQVDALVQSACDEVIAASPEWEIDKYLNQLK